MVKYGADALSGSDFLDDMIDAFVDAAAGTLGYAAPSFLPAIMAAAQDIKDPLHDIANDALKAASEWARHDQPERNRPKAAIMGKTDFKQMIDTCQPAYG